MQHHHWLSEALCVFSSAELFLKPCCDKRRSRSIAPALAAQKRSYGRTKKRRYECWKQFSCISASVIYHSYSASHPNNEQSILWLISSLWQQQHSAGPATTSSCCSLATKALLGVSRLTDCDGKQMVKCHLPRREVMSAANLRLCHVPAQLEAVLHALLNLIPFNASLLAAEEQRTHLVAMVCMAGSLTVGPSNQD